MADTAWASNGLATTVLATDMVGKYVGTLFTAFLVVAFAKSPEVAGEFVESIGELLQAVFEQLREVLDSLF